VPRADIPCAPRAGPVCRPPRLARPAAARGGAGRAVATNIDIACVRLEEDGDVGGMGYAKKAAKKVLSKKGSRGIKRVLRNEEIGPFIYADIQSAFFV